MDTKPAAAPSTGSAIKREGGGTRKQQRYRKWGKQQSAPHQTPPSTTKAFKGKTEGLEDCIFDLGTANQAEIFNLNLLKLSSYAARECREPLDIKKAIENISKTTIPLPMLRTGAAASGASQAVLDLILNRETDAFIKREGMYRQNKESMFSKILGQCTDALKAKLKNISAFELMNSTGNMIGLIKAIRDTL